MGSLFGGSEAKKGAEAQVQAQREAIAEQKQAFQQAAPGLAQFLSPYRQQAFIPAASLGQQQQGVNPFLQGGLQQLGGSGIGGTPTQPATQPTTPQQPGGGRTWEGARDTRGQPIPGAGRWVGGAQAQAQGQQPQSTMTQVAGQPAGGFATQQEAMQWAQQQGLPVGQQQGAGAAAGLQGQAQFDPLTQLRAASGALGPEAQAQFYQSFQEDPGTAFLREQGLRDINRQAAAQGGLGGASRLKATTQFSQGLANQQLQQRLAQLGGLAQTDIGLATGLANMRTGLGAATAQGLSNIGAARAQGYQAAGQAKQSAIQTGLQTGAAALALFSDRRLKDNVRKFGEHDGLNLYSWTWNAKAHELGAQYEPEFGFMADEVERSKYKKAVSVGKDGYKRVNYDMIMGG